ncbi:MULTISPECIES: cytochrome P450 [unclassified Phenylobacterium]|uniref:cytochrome P450 n=1 Tax=unclassified Phenylobacterium TaxID=2640670 RepID=UPI00083ABEB7|nr:MULTISPECIES: cytochrome P450 [unclassified Phenylobacterium]
MQDVVEGYTKPGHVPETLFVAGNIWEQLGDHPHARLKAIAAGRPLVYLERHNHQGHSPAGAWLACSAEANRQILMDAQTFPSSAATIFGKMLGGLKFFPVEVDPPDHAKYRALFAPFFKPAVVNAMKDKITARVDELIDVLAPKGGCEFISEFSRIFPASIFIDMAGLPHARADEFLAWARTALDQNQPADAKTAALLRIRDYLAEEIRARRDRPRDDMLSTIANAQIDGERISVDDATGGAIVLFIAGMDTVANLLGWVFLQLASDPGLQARLRAEPSILPGALEEMLRFFSPVTVSRRAARDADVCGVRIKAGDTVCCSMTLASRDEAEFPNPDTLNVDAPAQRHLAFGFGPHLCLGMHLARLEATVVLQRWFTRVPPFRVVPGSLIRRRGAGVLGVDELPLTWT